MTLARRVLSGTFGFLVRNWLKWQLQRSSQQILHDRRLNITCIEIQRRVPSARGKSDGIGRIRKIWTARLMPRARSLLLALRRRPLNLKTLPGAHRRTHTTIHHLQDAILLVGDSHCLPPRIHLRRQFFGDILVDVSLDLPLQLLHNLIHLLLLLPLL